MTTRHAQISPTAKIVAFLRAETDIPYYPEIADICDARTISRTIYDINSDKVASDRALMELRFKSLNVLIRRLGFKQLLELAAGVAPRGLILSEDVAMSIVETDLPEMLSEKRFIVESLIPLQRRTNYQLYPANALRKEDIEKVMSLLKQEPVTVAHEGLLQYLDSSEKKQLAANIRDLLERFGGAWVTPDITTQELFDRFYTDTTNTKMLKTIRGATGRNTAQNSFIDWEDAIRFFKEEGFTVERFKQIDLVPEIRIHISDPQILERIEYEEVWVLRLNN